MAPPGPAKFFCAARLGGPASLTARIDGVEMDFWSVNMRGDRCHLPAVLPPPAPPPSLLPPVPLAAELAVPLAFIRPLPPVVDNISLLPAAARPLGKVEIN